MTHLAFETGGAGVIIYGVVGGPALIIGNRVVNRIPANDVPGYYLVTKRKRQKNP